ncbi:MAG: hypothetical protein K8T10_13540 [Candidatus Eremiobacteraeota bacterium]|nr:hypothetical protein [Candidatus Eremiobacteraeota bacterium]
MIGLKASQQSQQTIQQIRSIDQAIIKATKRTGRVAIAVTDIKPKHPGSFFIYMVKLSLFAAEINYGQRPIPANGVKWEAGGEIT